MKRLIKRILRFLFGKDKDYRLDYIIDNIKSITIDDLFNISIYIPMNNRNVPYDIIKLIENLKELSRVLDEEVDESLPNEKAVMVSPDKTISIYKLLLVDGSVIPYNYHDLIKQLLIEYKKCKKIDSNADKSSLDTRHNSNLFNLYIITLEDIVNKLYWNVSNREVQNERIGREYK